MGWLARFVVRPRRAVIGSWIAPLFVIGLVGSGAFSVLSTDFGAGTSTESGRVAKQLDNLAETGGQIAIVADGIGVDGPQVERDITADLAQIAALDGVWMPVLILIFAFGLSQAIRDNGYVAAGQNVLISVERTKGEGMAYARGSTEITRPGGRHASHNVEQRRSVTGKDVVLLGAILWRPSRSSLRGCRP